jgi:hypothetical protein
MRSEASAFRSGDGRGFAVSGGDHLVCAAGVGAEPKAGAPIPELRLDPVTESLHKIGRHRAVGIELKDTFWKMLKISRSNRRSYFAQCLGRAFEPASTLDGVCDLPGGLGGCEVRDVDDLGLAV